MYIYIYLYCYFYSFIYSFIIFTQIYIYIYSMCIAHTHTGFCLLLTVSLFQSRLIAATEDMPIWPSISFWVSLVPCIPNYDISTRVSRQNVQSTFCQQPMHWRNGLWSHNQTISEAWPAEGKVPDTRYSHQPNPQLIAYQAPAHHSPCLVRFTNLMFLTPVIVFQLVFVVIFSRLCPQYFIAFGGLGIIAVWQQQGKFMTQQVEYCSFRSNSSVANVFSCFLRILCLNKDPPQYNLRDRACIFGKSYLNRCSLAGP